MRSYRLLLLSRCGVVVGTRCISCLEDREAIAAAEREARKCYYVEVWDGGRPVCICARPLAQGFSLANLVRRCRLSWTRITGNGTWQTCRDRFSHKHVL